MNAVVNATPIGSAQSGFIHLMKSLNNECAKSFQELIEDKHLYQTVKVDYAGIHKAIRSRVIAGAQAGFDATVRTTNFRVSLVESTDQTRLVMIPINVELYCEGKECCKKQAHRPIWFKEIIQDAQATTSTVLITPKLIVPELFQLIVIAYRCERCHGTPQVLVIRRSGWTFSLDCRSPIEHIEVPKHFPKKESHLYRDAVIASHAGKGLAALFYLRAFIEQWGRRITGMSGRNTGDEIMMTYAKTLPTHLRETMPSLKECYEKLSEPIHDARDDAEVFKEVIDKIDQHFEIRSAHRIPEVEMKEQDTVTENQPKNEAVQQIPNGVKKTSDAVTETEASQEHKNNDSSS
jgi:hypothetical protein